jgi:hypothetical protein
LWWSDWPTGCLGVRMELHAQHDHYQKKLNGPGFLLWKSASFA